MQDKIVPKLKVAIEKSNGEYSGYVIWDEFQLGYIDTDESSDNSEIYPKRRADRKLKPGDIPINIGIVSIGKIEIAT